MLKISKLTEEETQRLAELKKQASAVTNTSNLFRALVLVDMAAIQMASTNKSDFWDRLNILRKDITDHLHDLDGENQTITQLLRINY